MHDTREGFLKVHLDYYMSAHEKDMPGKPASLKRKVEYWEPVDHQGRETPRAYGVHVSKGTMSAVVRAVRLLGN